MLIELLRNGGNYTVPQVCLMVVMMLLALTLSFGFHEFMHAKVADWLGDDTPRLMGRVTLNPLAHLDPTGTILLLLVGFGWGKPVSFNPNNLTRFKSKRLMIILVSLAGVFGNFILALLSMIIVAVIMRVTGYGTPAPSAYCLDFIELGLQGHPDIPLPAAISCYVLYYIFSFSLSLMAFNLILLPPLDGFQVLNELLPYKARYSDGYKKYLQYGPMVLLGLVIIGSLSRFDILAFIISIIELPARIIINILVSWIGVI